MASGGIATTGQMAMGRALPNHPRAVTPAWRGATSGSVPPGLRMILGES